MVVCPKCGGSGRVHAEPAVFNAGNSVVCPQCKGTGQTSKGKSSKDED